MNRAFPLLLIAPALLAAAPEPIGQYGGWGAFRASAPRRCWAIARPERARKRDMGSLSITAWPDRRLFRQVQVRFREPAREAVAIISGQRFPLRADGWPATPKVGRRLVAAMRNGGMLRITWRSERGRRITDSYVLAGAPSAIDAADLACQR